MAELLDCQRQSHRSSDQAALPLTASQRAELDRRLDAYEADGNLGRPAEEALTDIRKRL